MFKKFPGYLFFLFILLFLIGIILFSNKGEKEWEFVNKDKNGNIGFLSWSRVIEDEKFIKEYKLLVEDKKCPN